VPKFPTALLLLLDLPLIMLIDYARVTFNVAVDLQLIMLIDYARVTQIRKRICCADDRALSDDDLLACKCTSM
jgi:hypothetical protein